MADLTSPTAVDPTTLGFEHVRYERDADTGVATVTIDRQDVLNALDFPTMRELARGFRISIESGSGSHSIGSQMSQQRPVGCRGESSPKWSSSCRRRQVLEKLKDSTAR